METDCKYLFVYGSLLINDNEFSIYLRNNSTYYAKGSFSGLLYNMGGYPGAIYDNDTLHKVYGDVVELYNKPEILKVIDQYEGFDNDEPQPNLFIRKTIPIVTTAGDINCWVYLYNLPLNGFPQIISGRYE